MLDDYRGEADFFFDACTINGNTFEEKECLTKALSLEKAANATDIRILLHSRN